MPSKSESLNRRVRQTISSLPDEDLVNMLKAMMDTYTPFALQVAKEELSRRRQIKAALNNASRVAGEDFEALEKQSASEEQAGCYIEVWSEKNFEGEHLRIEGPVERQSLDSASFDWRGSISSLRVGPTAFVLMYADENFNGATMSFGPGQKVADLEELKFNDEIDSIRLVNSIKIFDELRAEDSKKPLKQPAAKKQQNKGERRRKQRHGSAA